MYENAGLQVEFCSAEKTVIRLQQLPADCWVCGADATGYRLGIPVFEDFILPNDYEGEWGGVAACPSCFKKQEQLTAPVLVSKFKAICAP